MLPTVQQACDLLNFVEGALISCLFKVSTVVSWVAKWDGVGVVGVILDNLEMFADYRSFLEGVTNTGLKYTIIPKETVVQTSGLSAILKNYLPTITLAYFPGMLFHRTNKLRGSITITHSHKYGANDKTRAGATKEGWRLIFSVAAVSSWSR